MNVKLSNIRFEKSSSIIKIPKNDERIKEWLINYKLLLKASEREHLILYIRTLLFESTKLMFDGEIIPFRLSAATRENYFACIDIIDDFYAEEDLQTVYVSYSCPDTFECILDDIDPLADFDEDVEQACWEYLRHYMPVTITVDEWSVSEQLRNEADFEADYEIMLPELLTALEEHTTKFLSDEAALDDYDEAYDIKLIVGNKTFNLGFNAALATLLPNMIEELKGSV